MRKKERIQKLLEYVLELYPDKVIELDYETDFQLLMAVMMSAQTTDKQVNKVSPELFSIVREPKDVRKFSIEEIQNMISRINYYRNKGRFIYQTGIMLDEQYNGKIPRKLEEITKLAGVGIKTGKVVLNNLYGDPYIGVDTHIHRVLNRTKIVKTKTPEQTDKEIDKLFTKEQKIKAHHALVLFGRYNSTARNPQCYKTKVVDLCHCVNCTKHKKENKIAQ